MLRFKIIMLLLVAGAVLLGGLLAIQRQENLSPEPPQNVAEPVIPNPQGVDWLSPSITLNDFTLTTAEGEPFQLSNERGKTLLVYFGYMTCPDICPTGMANMMRAYRELGEDSSQYELIFITVDPQRDTPERLQRYVNAFHADFIGLRDDDMTTIEPIMRQFGVVAIQREVDSALGYLVDHTAAIFIIAPDNTLQVRLAHDVDYQTLAETARKVQEG